MIISASRRTDIPAFYSDWLFNRLREGFVLVRNPMNIHQVSKIRLTPDVVDCIVFWTKKPANLIQRHCDELNKIQTPFYFQFTINPYDKSIEPNVPYKKHIFSTFIKLSSIVGKERLIWRYDPIIFTDKITFGYHCKFFEMMTRLLVPYTNKCIISFLDFYKKTKRNMQSINVLEPSKDIKILLCQNFHNIASRYGLKIVTCAEALDLSHIGIHHGKCIDPGLIAHLCNGHILAQKDKNQREECGCIESIDIGSYNTCRHGCLYCYANFSKEAVERQSSSHNPVSPLLFGELNSDDNIVERKMKSIVDRQQDLLCPMSE